MASIALSLVSHTNVGKTTLARTLLGRDVGEVRDAPHVTEFTDEHELLRSDAGDALTLWDTPGFGDSVRLLRRLRQAANPLGWFLSEVWDRWRDRPFWAGQQVLRHVRARSDVLLYLVNAAEAPAAAGYVAAEMELLDWVGKPVLVLLNQLGPPRPAQIEAAEQAQWREHLARWPRVRAVLPLDAFARCWVQEGALWQAVRAALPASQQAVMAGLQAAWQRQRRQVFEDSMQTLSASLARIAALREPLDDTPPGRLRQIGSALGLGGPDRGALEAAQGRLLARIDDESRISTDLLLRLHGLDGKATPSVLQRVAALFEPRRKVDEGRAAWVGGLVSGALGGLAADVAAGGLTLGGGALAGGILGALGAAGVARGVNLVRGTDHSSVGLQPDALQPLAEAALLRYLAVAHYGRGRGDWAESESPPHWVAVVQAALDSQAAVLRSVVERSAPPGAEAELRALLSRCAQQVLFSLYPGAASSNGAPPATPASDGLVGMDGPVQL